VRVSEGLKTTFELLSTTENEAAVWTLIPALDSPNAAIREGTLAAILRRRSPAGHRELLRRWHLIDDRTKEVVRGYHSRMVQALRDAVQGNDAQLCANACQASTWFRQYELISSLLVVLENPGNPNGPLAAKTLTELTNSLYAELAEPEDNQLQRNPQLIRHRVVGDLELAVARFGKHRRREIINTFVLLVNRDNATFKQILMEPHHAAFVPMVEVLSKSAAGGVIRLLLSFLDDPHAPSVALLVLSKRCDRKYLEHLLHRVDGEFSAVAKQNLKRITSILWLQNDLPLLGELDGAAQRGAIKLALHSGIPRSQCLAVIAWLLKLGQPEGRRAAAEALQKFGGAEANALALAALRDDDPQVQATIIPQLRNRGIPGALPCLVEMVESPHPLVRQAARESLSEFTFKRFLAAFDMLDDEVRRSTGILVKKVDPQTLPLLEAEMASQLRTRRCRALAIAQSIDAVPSLESAIARLLRDDDSAVRAEAAGVLAEGASQASLEALQQALQDRTPSVQEAARRSLCERAVIPEPWETAEHEEANP
jgi:HEAT repeat protein